MSRIKITEQRAIQKLYKIVHSNCLANPNGIREHSGLKSEKVKFFDEAYTSNAKIKYFEIYSSKRTLILAFEAIVQFSPRYVHTRIIVD